MNEFLMKDEHVNEYLQPEYEEKCYLIAIFKN
jgi:hypothetical protein